MWGTIEYFLNLVCRKDKMFFFLYMVGRFSMTRFCLPMVMPFDSEMKAQTIWGSAVVKLSSQYD